MEMLLVVTIVLTAASLMLAINALIFKAIVNKALKSHIRPYLSSLDYSIKKVEFAGLFKTGDFKRTGFQLRPFMPNGYPMQHTYIYLDIQKQNANCQIRITIKIITFFLSIRRVEYSRNLES